VAEDNEPHLDKVAVEVKLLEVREKQKSLVNQRLTRHDW
jgi:hypothetical protein